MDFVHDQLANGRKSQVLTVIDKYGRKSVTPEVDFAMSGRRCIRWSHYPAALPCMPSALAMLPSLWEAERQPTTQ